jgi:hypothetical protein
MMRSFSWCFDVTRIGRARTVGAKASLIHPSHQGVCWRPQQPRACRRRDADRGPDRHRDADHRGERESSSGQCGCENKGRAEIARPCDDDIESGCRPRMSRINRRNGCLAQSTRGSGVSRAVYPASAKTRITVSCPRRSIGAHFLYPDHVEAPAAVPSRRGE